jgi:DNA repair exonuclease SbcCD ATPase subunit
MSRKTESVSYYKKMWLEEKTEREKDKEKYEAKIEALEHRIKELKKEMGKPEKEKKAKLPSGPTCPDCGSPIAEIPMANGKKAKVCYPCRTKKKK